MDFSVRSYRKELLDQNDIPFADIERNMVELDFINTWLGGHSISLDGLKPFAEQKKELTICEIGSGGGDNLRVICQWCRRHGINVRVIGIDCNPHCVQVAKERWIGTNAEWVESDYHKLSFSDKKPDIIFSSLFCHHFRDEELVAQLQWMEANAEAGWFINDLQRHPVAYYSIAWLTRAFSRSYLVKNDAPLSVLRGFHRQEWTNILGKAGISDYKIRWKWAFRWLITRQL